MKKLFAGILFFVFYDIALCQDTLSIILKNGLVDPTQEEKKLIPVGAPLRNAVTNFPDSVDLSCYLNVAGFQGDFQGSCSAFVVGFGIKTIQENIKANRKNSVLNDDILLSPAFVFNRGKQLTGSQGNCDVGLTLIQALTVLKEEGTVPLGKCKYFAFDPNGCAIPIEPPSLFVEAKKHRISSFDAPELSMKEFRRVLSKNYPIAIAVKIDNRFIRQGFDANNNWSTDHPFIWRSYRNPNPGDSELIRHALLCVGYNKRLNAFKVLNSWGTKFGDGGFFYIDFDFMFKATYDAYIAIDRATGQKDETIIHPTGSSGMNISPRNEFTSWVKAGYYQEFNNFRIGCFYLSKKNNIATFQITDIEKNKVLNRIDVNLGEQKEFDYEGFHHVIRLDRIGAKGWIFSRAAFFSYFINEKN